MENGCAQRIMRTVRASVSWKQYYSVYLSIITCPTCLRKLDFLLQFMNGHYLKDTY